MKSISSKKNSVWLLIFALGLGIILYLYKLDTIPNGIYADESTVGYNAFSVLKTGKDEYGKSFPVAFRFFGAYTPPLAVYLVIPLIKIFGLKIFAVRLVSVISTIITIYVVYQFGKSLKIFSNSISSGILAIIFSTSPWVIFNARLGYEVTLGYAVFGLGTFLIWRSLQKNEISWLGLLAFSISTYIAHTERYLVPLFILCLLVLFKERIITNLRSKKSILFTCLLLLTQIPNIFLLSTPAFWVKNKAFASQTLSGSITDFVNQLLVYLSPQTYFGHLNADINLQHFIPNISLFYSWQIIPFLIGLYILIKNIKRDSSRYIILMLLTAVIPGSFSGHFISIQRVLTVIIPFSIIIALGIDHLISYKKNQVLISFVFLFSFSLLLLWRSYFILLPGLRTNWWNYGAEEIAQFISQNSQSRIVIDNSRDQALYSPIVFYLQYPSEVFQQQFDDVVSNYYANPPYGSNVTFGNASTRAISWEIDPLIESFLIGDPLSVSSDQASEHFLTFVESIKDKTGKVHFNIYRTNPTLKLQDNARKQQKNYNN